MGSQYESVWSKPQININSEKVMRMFEACLDCDNELVHICKEDLLLTAVDRYKDAILEVKTCNNEINIKTHKHVFMEWVYHSEDDFMKIIDKLDNNAACGPDGGSVFLIKKLKVPISRFL